MLYRKIIVMHFHRRRIIFTSMCMCYYVIHVQRKGKGRPINIKKMVVALELDHQNVGGDHALNVLRDVFAGQLASEKNFAKRVGERIDEFNRKLPGGAAEKLELRDELERQRALRGALYELKQAQKLTQEYSQIVAPAHQAAKSIIVKSAEGVDERADGGNAQDQGGVDSKASGVDGGADGGNAQDQGVEASGDSAEKRKLIEKTMPYATRVLNRIRDHLLNIYEDVLHGFDDDTHTDTPPSPVDHEQGNPTADA
ncbi:unnamed protein product [Amoebophrya sp. A25]|nr:unnamed protein product [Amoebophrya sp. A25]|eukprot:GSA25T00010816001.1